MNARLLVAADRAMRTPSQRPSARIPSIRSRSRVGPGIAVPAAELVDEQQLEQRVVGRVDCSKPTSLSVRAAGLEAAAGSARGRCA